MRDSLVKELGDGFKPKNLTIMTFYGCKLLKKILDLSSISNLKELIVQYCKRLVEVHDSVGSLKNLSRLDFDGCSKLQILPRSLKLRSLCELNLGTCSSLRDFPKIECKMKCLRKLSLYSTAVEKLPLSIRNLVGLETLDLLDCKNLMRLRIASIPLKYLCCFCMGGHDSVNLPNDSTTMEDEISNSRNGSTVLHVLNLQISCSHSESNFFPLCSLFAMFNSSNTLDSLSLSGLEIVSLPKSIKESVTLTNLTLARCCKLEEIPELPPNIRQGLYGYDATLFSKNQLSYFHEFLKVKEMVKWPDDEEDNRLYCEFASMTSSMAFQLGASSSSSSPSILQWNHDVFLSFRGKDVRHNFISHLNHALCQSGIKTYMDGIDLERGEQISSELFKAIE
ncbi:disease resistance protein Roq1-like [Carya illinoinensis]|uniref:disease resistance protein Roq1-like n=1 Tax=Carya illinoinensis TaxID=32201 RepID=UPI001C723C27|nr:disease resistance protein Roq1-like [Carya illinoinensis]